MRSHLVIIVDLFRKDASKARSNNQYTFAEPTRSSVQHIRSAKASGTRWSVPDAHCSHPSLERAAKCSVIITDEISGRALRPKGMLR
jgi:hypothetical protein